MLLASPHRPGCVSLCQTVVYSVYCIQVASVLGLPVAAMVPTQQSQTNANFYLCPAQPPARDSLSLSPVFVIIARLSRHVLYTWQTLWYRVMINSISRALHYFILNILSWTQVEDGACPQCRHYQFLERQLGVEQQQKVFSSQTLGEYDEYWLMIREC